MTLRPHAPEADERGLDVFEFARANGHLARDTPLAWLPRLSASLLEQAGERSVRWTLAGSVGARPGGGRAAWLDLEARFDAPLQCMRCLEPVLLPIEVRRRFKLEHDERAVEAEPLDEDAHDAIVGSAHFDVLELLEDEALLSLPLVPRHAACSLPAGARSGEPDAAAEHPFAALAALRRAPSEPS